MLARRTGRPWSPGSGRLRVREPTVGLPAFPDPRTGRRGAGRGRGPPRRRVGWAPGSPRSARPGDDDTVVVAFPFRHRGTAELFGDAVAGAFAAITAVTRIRPGSPRPRSRQALAGHDPGETVAAAAPARSR